MSIELLLTFHVVKELEFARLVGWHPETIAQMRRDAHYRPDLGRHPTPMQRWRWK